MQLMTGLARRRGRLVLAPAIGGLWLAASLGTAPPAVADAPIQADEPLVYVAVAPCRIVKTSGSVAGNLVADTAQDFFAFGDAGTIGPQGGVGSCPHPQAAEGRVPVAMAANVTAVGNQAAVAGNVVAYAVGGTVPSASLVNFTPNANIANSTIIPLCFDSCANNKQFSLRATQNVPALVDVQGYFYRRNLQNVVTVSAAGADYTTPQAAIDAISDEGPSNRYVVKIGPGEYPGFDMKPYVDVEGAGNCVTRISASGGGTQAAAATVEGAANASLHDLCIESDGTGQSFAVGLAFDQVISTSTTPALYERLSIKADGGTTAIGIYNFRSAVRIANVSVTVGAAASSDVNIGVQYLNDSAGGLIHPVVHVSNGPSGNFGIDLDTSDPSANPDPAIYGASVTVAGPVDAQAIGLDLSGAAGVIEASTFDVSGGGVSSVVRGANLVSSDKVIIKESTLEASSGGTDVSGLQIDGASPLAQIVNSLIIGGVLDAPTETNCFGNYNNSGAPEPC